MGFQAFENEKTYLIFFHPFSPVKFHPYDLFYHDRLEMLSLISSEMTLFGGLLITFLNEDKETCLTECETFKANAEGSSSAIGYVIIFFNLLYLSYFMFGVLFHMYYVLIPARCRCKKVEVAADAGKFFSFFLEYFFFVATGT